LFCGRAAVGFDVVAGAANGLAPGRFKEAKQASTSASALEKPSSGSLSTVCAVLTSSWAAVASFCMNGSSAPSSIMTIFGPMASALASLRNTGAAISCTGNAVCGVSSHSSEPSAMR
jgi:hypothetical protein